MSFLDDAAQKIRNAFPSLNRARTEVDTVFGLLREKLTAGEAVDLPGIGRFSVNDTSERKGRNVVTGESLTIPAGRRLAFKQAPAMKRALNGR